MNALASVNPVGMSRRRLKPLAVSVGALFLLSAPLVVCAASTWIVNSCDEGNSGDIPSKTGTLRFAAAQATTGDTIDMTTLACSTISLHTGAIVFGQTDLNVNGPGKANLTITGSYNGVIEHDRIITHTGAGQLQLGGVSLSNGYVVNLADQGGAKGGCINTAGTLLLVNADVHDCKTLVDKGFSYGGGVYAKGGLLLKYDVISHNNADSVNYMASGGGVYSKGQMSIKYSTVSENTATSHNGFSAYGGGVTSTGSMFITHSTISGNFAGILFGGVNSYNRFGYGPLTTTIIDSTISGNSAGVDGGGVYSNLGNVHIYNSTIAFNSPGGVLIQNRGTGSAVKLISNVIAQNGTDFVGLSNFTVTGHHNLIRVANTAMPPDTLTGCPLLGPLAFNGGPTRTHALRSGSLAIDAGINVGGLKQDQRGLFGDPAPYPYPRGSGTAVDIGAYELQQGDVIFVTGFEGC
jgi:hypothetical protein